MPLLWERRGATLKLKTSILSDMESSVNSAFVSSMYGPGAFSDAPITAWMIILDKYNDSPFFRMRTMLKDAVFDAND